jgi:hypothetical protein
MHATARTHLAWPSAALGPGRPGRARSAAFCRQARRADSGRASTHADTRGPGPERQRATEVQEVPAPAAAAMAAPPGPLGWRRRPHHHRRHRGGGGLAVHAGRHQHRRRPGLRQPAEDPAGTRTRDRRPGPQSVRPRPPAGHQRTGPRHDDRDLGCQRQLPGPDPAGVAGRRGDGQRAQRLVRGHHHPLARHAPARGRRRQPPPADRARRHLVAVLAHRPARGHPLLPPPPPRRDRRSRLPRRLRNVSPRRSRRAERPAVGLRGQRHPRDPPGQAVRQQRGARHGGARC